MKAAGKDTRVSTRTITMHGVGETKLEKDSAGSVRLVSRKRREKNAACEAFGKTAKSMRRLAKKLRKDRRENYAQCSRCGGFNRVTDAYCSHCGQGAAEGNPADTKLSMLAYSYRRGAQ